MSEQTFSESWYRIANQKICLRQGVRTRRQNFRGERWIVIENPFSNQFYRLRPAAYEFVARLRPDLTVQEVWQQCLDKFPDEAPGQEAVIQLLSQLYFSNLLQYDLASDSSQLFQRYKKRRQREIGFGFLNIMFMRFPLLDPDRFLVRAMPLVGKAISALGALVWLLVVGCALKVVMDNFPALRQQTQGVLAPDNLLLLYAGLVVTKTIHEFGHAFFCRKFGGEVHVMGVMLMIFTPMPFVDATSSWGFRSRWKRILVGAAGMIVEIFFAALATFVWARTGQGTLHSLAYNMMFVASVSTLVFNLNPLLRFDGYYILSDLLEIPNLSQRANNQLTHLFERYLFGVVKSFGPAQSGTEAFWLVVFGITSGIYRVIVFSGVLLAVADRFLIIGLVMAVVCLISWVTVPIWKLVKYLSASPRLDRVRTRAVAVTVAIAVGLLILLDLVPFPNHFRASGVVKTTERSGIANETAGNIKAVLAQSGQTVVAGQPLITMENRELELDLAHSIARSHEVEARLTKATKEGSADLKPLIGLRDSIDSRIQKLTYDTKSLVVRARHDGIWVAPGIEDYKGRWIPRGSHLGILVNPASFEFTATVMQVDVDSLFAQKMRGAEVRLFGQAGESLPVEEWRVIPGEQKLLPSPALGWHAGGDVPVDTEAGPGDKDGGSKAAEPFFEVIGKLSPAGDVLLRDGRSGKIRFNLQPEPLLPRWIRRLRQLLQQRYEV